ncbi:MAG: hypothetical protein ACR2JA_04395 [Hydrogenophaga sp.]|uniref:hypothetical protein n=1 Tax=Hydrogenophaga sp. TaxID=1904254 RepID=UPI003D9ADB7A
MSSRGVTVERLLERGQVMDATPDAGLAWRVERGLLLVHSPGSWRLALPGDWLNIEALCGLPPDTRNTALIPSRLQALPALPARGSHDLLTRVVHQQRQWADHLLALRSGSVEQRIRHLLDLVRQAVGGARGDAAEPDLPALRDIAALVDAAPETACRVLARVRPARQSARPASSAHRSVLACA